MSVRGVFMVLSSDLFLFNSYMLASMPVHSTLIVLYSLLLHLTQPTGLKTLSRTLRDFELLLSPRIGSLHFRFLRYFSHDQGVVSVCQVNMNRFGTPAQPQLHPNMINVLRLCVQVNMNVMGTPPQPHPNMARCSACLSVSVCVWNI